MERMATAKWNCVTSRKLLGCYFKHLKEEEENRDGTIRSKSVEEEKLKCSPEEYQQIRPILMENIWHEQLCECDVCLKMYQDYNVEFLFGIKNIECLPTEMLLMIFKHLIPSDRRVVSECCKRFIEIWLCDDFADDRHRLVFDCCVLDAEREPLSVFLKSERTYRHLAFGNVIIRGELRFGEKFWENATVLELMNGCSGDMLPFLSILPNIKTIKVADMKQLAEFSDVPTTTELLVISGNHFEYAELDSLKLFLDKTSDSFRVELNGKFSKKQTLALTESQRNKIQGIHLNLRSTVSELFFGRKKFKMPRFGNLKYLKLYGYYWTEDVFDDLEEQCPALNDLSINIFNSVPHKVMYIRKEVMSRLNIFENLKELTLESNKCLFTHETFCNKNLKTLDIICRSEDQCFTCFQTMINSFPNLESLTCDFQVTNVHLAELATKIPELRSLDLTSSSNLDPSVSFTCLPNLTKLSVGAVLTIHLIETWPLMFQLRKLTIHLPHLNFDTVKIFERTPALEDLNIICDEIDGDQVLVFETLTKPLKRLTKIWFDCELIQYEIYPIIIDVIARNCKYLQQITFNNQETGKSYASEETLQQLLQKHSSIRCIDSVWLK